MRATAAAWVVVAMPLVGLASPGRGLPSNTASLAEALRTIYAAPGEPDERWRHAANEIVLADGTRAPRDQAYRDHPAFLGAAKALLDGTGDDRLLGAWLLGTAPEARRMEAASILGTALRHPDPHVRFETAKALGGLGNAGSLPPLLALAQGDEPENAAAIWAARRIAEREGLAPPPAPASPAGVAAGFCRGVNWWLEEGGDDAGATSFRALRALGVDWISIHTWDPLQRDVHSPEWARPRRPAAIPRLRELVANAHREGLKVMVKPHLELRGYEPTDEEIRIFRGQDEAARQKLMARLRLLRESRPRV